jgi:hypothetical protein
MGTASANLVDMVTCDNRGEFGERQINRYQTEKSEMNVAIILGACQWPTANRDPEAAKRFG